MDVKYMEKLNATGTLSKLSPEEIDIISKIEKMWYATKLRNYGISQTVNIDSNHSRWNGAENVIVIDITKEPWVKILGHMNGATQVHGVTDMVMNNNIHNTCRATLHI